MNSPGQEREYHRSVAENNARSARFAQEHGELCRQPCPDTCCETREESTWFGKLVLLPIILALYSFVGFCIYAGVYHKIESLKPNNKTAGEIQTEFLGGGQPIEDDRPAVEYFEEASQGAFIFAGVVAALSLPIIWKSRHTIKELFKCLCCPSTSVNAANATEERTNNRDPGGGRRA